MKLPQCKYFGDLDRQFQIEIAIVGDIAQFEIACVYEPLHKLCHYYSSNGTELLSQDFKL